MACTELVRQHDPDRFYSVLLAPKNSRAALIALYALNYEIARVGESVREPMMGEIRLQWWREVVEGARAGKPRNHDVALALACVFEIHDLPQELFDAMIEARRFDISSETFENPAALEDYAAGVSGALMQLAARILGADVRADVPAREAGIAYAISGMLRAIPHHAGREKLYLPLNMLSAAKLAPADIFRGQGGAPLKGVMAALALQAQQHLDAARKLKIARGHVAAVLPAALVPDYLKLMTRAWFDPFRHPATLSQSRRQWSLLMASMKGQL